MSGFTQYLGFSDSGFRLRGLRVNLAEGSGFSRLEGPRLIRASFEFLTRGSTQPGSTNWVGFAFVWLSCRL